MTRQEVQAKLPIIQAFSEGKEIQILSTERGWVTTENLIFNLSPNFYRIKPEPKYRPFENQEECWQEMQKHQPFGWVKNECGNIFNIIAIFKESIKLNESSHHYSDLCKHFKFMDGTPFGIKEDQL